MSTIDYSIITAVPLLHQIFEEIPYYASVPLTNIKYLINWKVNQDRPYWTKAEIAPIFKGKLISAPLDGQDAQEYVNSNGAIILQTEDMLFNMDAVLSLANYLKHRTYC